MAKVLSLFRRKAGPDDDDARAAPPPAPAPRPAKPRSTNDGDGAAAAEGEGGEAAAVEAPPIELVSRRQSQINLNKFLAGAPSGLTAVLKQPSRGDLLLEPARSQGSGSLQPAFSLQQQQQHQSAQQLSAQQPGAAARGSPGRQQQTQPAQQQQQSQSQSQSQSQPGGDSPPVKPLRERRKSMAASELAASLQNIDVTQAAMIMMPARLKQELVGAQTSASQPLPSLMSVPAPLRASAPLPAAILSADSYLLSATMNGGGGAAAAAGPRLERKPSLIREAVVKVTTQQQQQQQPGLTRGSAVQESPLRNQATGDSGQERASGMTLAARRGSVAPHVNAQQLQQQQGGGGGGGGSGSGGGALLGGPSRASMAVGGLGSPPSPTHGPQRRSEVGEPGPALRTRGSVPMGSEAPGAALSSNGGHPLSPTGNGNGGSYLLPGAPSSKDLRRGGLATRGSEMLAMALSTMADGDGLAGAGSSSQYDAVRLPVIGGNGTPTRRVNIDIREPGVHGGGGGGRGGLTAADVAALSEAISSYETEAARLRAMAVRKVDSRIKRAVMDRRLTADEEAVPPAASLLEGSVAGSLLAPLMRPQPGGSSSRNNLQQPASRSAPRGSAHANGAGTGAGTAGAATHGSTDVLTRVRTRLQETEAETSEELNHMRRSSVAPRLIAHELMTEPPPLVTSRRR